MLYHAKNWMTAPGTRCPHGAGLERPTTPMPSVCHALHGALYPTNQLTDELVDLAQANIPPAGTSERLAHLGLQRRVEGKHAGNVVEQ